MPTIATPQGDIHYRRIGRGPRVMIAFHGYSEDSSSFLPLAPAFEHNITLYALDLPFHGQTQWNRKTYKPKHLAAAVEMLLEQIGATHFEALGYSMGGRIWLKLCHQFQGRIDALYLLAPDGVGTQGASWVEWIPASTRKFITASTSQDWVISLAYGLKPTGIVNDLIIRYLRYHLCDPDRKSCMLNTWCSLSYFRMDRKRAARILTKLDVPTLILAGKKDMIVPASELNALANRLDNVIYQALPVDHLAIIPTSAPYLADGLMRYWKWIKPSPPSPIDTQYRLAKSPAAPPSL